MRSFILTVAAVLSLLSALSPAFALTYDHVNDCNTVPKQDWAQCIIDQSQQGDSE